MSTYTATIIAARNIGESIQNASPNSTTTSFWFDPQVGVNRIRTVLQPHLKVDQIGGLMSADFIVPPEEAAWCPALRQYSLAWLYDGAAPIFYGMLDKPTLQADGSIQVVINGPWMWANLSQMREIWDDWDPSHLNLAPNSRSAGSITTNANGSFSISIPKGTVLAANDKVAADYLAFGEPAQPYDNKLVTAFEFGISALNFPDTANLELAFYGRSSPSAASGDLLYTYATNATLNTSGRQGAQNLAGGNQHANLTGPNYYWPSQAGYRDIRVGLYAQNAFTTTADNVITFSHLRFSTRESMFTPWTGTGMDTGAIARDVLKLVGGANSPANQQNDIIPEFWRPLNSSGSYIYGGYGNGEGVLIGDPLIGTGSAPNSGVTINGFNTLGISTWTTPADVFQALAAMDGSYCGFDLPIQPLTGYAQGGGAEVTSFPIQAFCPCPRFVYQQYAPVATPDYFVSIEEGANISPVQNIQPLLDRFYVTYNTASTSYSAQSTVVEDSFSSPRYGAYNDWPLANGYIRSGIYEIAPTLGGVDGGATPISTANTVATQNIGIADVQLQVGTIELVRDGISRYPIIKSDGSIPTKWALLRPGVYQVVDIVGRSRANTGYATSVEWWGASVGQPERVTITLGVPGQMRLDRALGRVAWLANITYAGRL